MDDQQISRGASICSTFILTMFFETALKGPLELMRLAR